MSFALHKHQFSFDGLKDEEDKVVIWSNPVNNLSMALSVITIKYSLKITKAHCATADLQPTNSCRNEQASR